MDFCKESDYYVSLYIDDMLEEAIKADFEKHLNECSKCSHKVKEALAFAELCRESGDMMLPQNFSSSLHNRLVEVSEDQKVNKGKLFIYNKKLIAGLSTAAVLIICFVAYNLLPHTDLNRQAAGISTGITASNSAQASTGDSASSTQEPVQNFSTQKSNNNASQPSSDKLTAENSRSTVKDYPKKRVTEEQGENKAVLKSSKSTKKMDTESEEETESVYKTKIAEDTVSMQYFSNTAEMTLNSETQDKENEDEALKGLMSELGGKELTVDDDTVFIMAQNNYVDYVIPLDSFTKIQQLANDKYNLDISIKLPVTKENITEQYNELEKQRDELTQKINNMEIKGENTLTLEKERNDLSQKMDEIVKNSGMITVRIFFADK